MEPCSVIEGRPGAGALCFREATAADWPDLWRFVEPVVAAGETYCWDRGSSSQRIRALWMHEPPGRTFVAELDGRVVGTAALHPNQEGPGSHVANAGFIIDADAGVRGIGRALAEHVLQSAREDGYRAMQFNAVVQTNVRAVALWHSLGFRTLATVPEAFDHPTTGLVGLHVMYRDL